MKILDIIADESLNEAGAAAREGGRWLSQYLERKAAERALAAIEKKYANDIVRQKAAKDVAERYAKLLADAEAAGTPRIKGGLTDLVALLKDAAKNPNHPTLSNNRYYEDTAFLQMVDDLAEARKKQMVRDIQNPPAPPKEKKPKDEKPKDADKTADDGAKAVKSTATKETADATDELVKKKKSMFDFVYDRGKLINTLYYGVLGVEFGLIWVRWNRDTNTIKKAVQDGKIPSGDERFWPRSKNGENVSTDVSQGIGIRDNPMTKPTQPYVYNNDASRLYNWADWRKNQSFDTFVRQLILAGTAFKVGELAVGAIGAAKVFNGLVGLIGKIAPNAKINRLAEAFDATAISMFVFNMSSDEGSEALKSLYMNWAFAPFIHHVQQSAGRSIMVYESALKFIDEVASSALELVGGNLGTNPPDPATPVNVPPAPPQPAASSPASQEVSKTDSNGGAVTPKDKKEPETPKDKKEPETPKVTSQDVYNDTRAGRGKAVTNAKASGAPTVTIGGKTYKTSDFSDVDGEWVTNDGYALPK